MEEEITYSAFTGQTLIASGRLESVITAVKARFDQPDCGLILMFEDQSGKQVDFDLRGTPEQVLVRALPKPVPIGPGRPKLGVVSREVSLLPRHWAWLEQQPNGASAALRRLVEQARKTEPGKQRARLAAEGTGRFMAAMAGNLPHYEEATRALYSNNRTKFEDLVQDWPNDIRLYILRLARDAFHDESAAV